MKRIALVGLVVCLIGCGKQRDSKVVFTTKDGEEVQDLKKVEDGELNYKVVGKGEIPAKAHELHELGRRYGAQGKFDAALLNFGEASKLAPGWAYPIYDTAYTLLLRGDATNALAKYREVDRMETNGFFTTKTAVWTLEREESGALPRGTYQTYVALEGVDTKAKGEMIERLAVMAPRYPPVWKEKVLAAKTATEKLELIDKALALEPDAETYGILMLNRAVILNLQKKTNEAKAILNGLTAETNTVGTRELAREVLKKI
jgi:tetratricopeptide (TPR) repeat protein